MIKIRAERIGDEGAIAALLQASFGGETEARLTDRLREEGELLLSLVAERAGDIVGHVGFAQSWLEQDGRRHQGLAWLVPLSVAPRCQRSGIGTALVQQGLDRCRALGLRHAVVVGDPGYYSRFGFSREAAKGLVCRWPEALMAVSLCD